MFPHEFVLTTNIRDHRYIVLAMLVSYLVISNILLVNLLIAMMAQT